MLEAEQVLKKINSKLSGEYNEFQKGRNIKILISIAEKLNDDQKKNKIINKNLTHSGIRKIRLAELLEAEDYENAKTLVEEGIIVAEKKGHPRTVSGWEDQLIRISQLEKDIKTERRLLEKKVL